MLYAAPRGNRVTATAALLMHGMVSQNLLLGVISPSALSRGGALHFMIAVMTAYLRQNDVSAGKRRINGHGHDDTD